jgi:hypothetical protein
MEWPKGESEPTKYWLSTLPPTTNLEISPMLGERPFFVA